MLWLAEPQEANDCNPKKKCSCNSSSYSHNGTRHPHGSLEYLQTETAKWWQRWETMEFLEISNSGMLLITWVTEGCKKLSRYHKKNHLLSLSGLMDTIYLLNEYLLYMSGRGQSLIMRELRGKSYQSNSQQSSLMPRKTSQQSSIGDSTEISYLTLFWWQGSSCYLGQFMHCKNVVPGPLQSAVVINAPVRRNLFSIQTGFWERL